MQPVDYTTLVAVCGELRRTLLPARVETVYQCDRHTLALGLRTFEGRRWLTISWHPEAARLHLGDAPPRDPDTFAFSQQLLHQLKGLALGDIAFTQPWERSLDLQFAPRPGEPARWHLYLEVMGKHSNLLLVDADGTIVTAAHQVGSQQSSVRPIQTGGRYVPPPGLTEATPDPIEAFDRWRERVALIPGAIARQLRSSYRGLGTRLSEALVAAAGLSPEQPSDQLTETQWQVLFAAWTDWLQRLESGDWQPHRTERGYQLLPGTGTPQASVNDLLNHYYGDQTRAQRFQQLRQQMLQKLKGLLAKLEQKCRDFEQRLQQSDGADDYRRRADLLMAHLQDWQPGLTELVLTDFETGQPCRIALAPEKTAIQNAQALYKRHQKLKRTREAVEPLLAAAIAERDYLGQVEAAIAALTRCDTPADLLALQEIQEELQQQGYLPVPDYRQRRASEDSATDFLRFPAPGGGEIWVGRNNRQNDQLTFRVATDYDLWFHTQEIAGSHVLLRRQPGQEASDEALQAAADLAAWFSRGRGSEQVPVIWTEPRLVFKPRGAKPGMVVYRQEQVIWAQPQRGAERAIAPVGEDRSVS